MKKIYQLIEDNFLVSALSGFFPKKEKEIKKTPPLITLSREMGSGGRPISYLVAKKLRKPWQVYNKEIIKEIANETKLERKLIAEIDEANIPLIEEMIADFFGKHYFSLSSYYKNLVKILSTIGNRGYAVIIGRGANFLFTDSLKVRIICEMPQRIKWLMQYEKISKNEAISRIAESDRKRKDFVEEIYRHDSRKAHHYDLVIRTGPNLGIEEAAELIVHAAKRRFKL